MSWAVYEANVWLRECVGRLGHTHEALEGYGEVWGYRWGYRACSTTCPRSHVRLRSAYSGPSAPWPPYLPTPQGFLTLFPSFLQRLNSQALTNHHVLADDLHVLSDL